MSKQGNPKLIGAFVVGAAALVVVGILIFGSGRWFSERPVFVMFFDGSVSGLNVGSPLVWRGVKIGEVKKVSLFFDPNDISVHIPVLVEFNPQSITRTPNGQTGKNYYRELIDKGLKAQLQTQSLLTGQLMINLDFYPNQPIVFQAKQFNLDYPEIPTIPSTIERFTDTIGKIDFEEISADLSNTLDSINQIVQSPEILDTIRNVNKAVRDLQALTNKIQPLIEPLAGDLSETTNEAKNLLIQLNNTLPPMAREIGKVAKTTSEAAVQLEDALQRSTGEDSAFFYRLNKAVEDLSAMAKSIQEWSDFAQQHPEALLRGKGVAAER